MMSVRSGFGKTYPKSRLLSIGFGVWNTVPICCTAEWVCVPSPWGFEQIRFALLSHPNWVSVWFKRVLVVFLPVLGVKSATSGFEIVWETDSYLDAPGMTVPAGP